MFYVFKSLGSLRKVLIFDRKAVFSMKITFNESEIQSSLKWLIFEKKNCPLLYRTVERETGDTGRIVGEGQTATDAGCRESDSNP